ncbi:MAG: TIGR04086 family membrane protein [Clostridia bacterium]|nr:TIGR04086 family membrane protein [Clostridia bacterium]
MQYQKNKVDFFPIVKAVLLALGISLLLAVTFAVVLRATSWGENIVYPVNQVIKVIAVMVGTLVFVRGEKGWLQGGIVGLLFTALSYLAFSSIGGDFSLSWLILLELGVAFLAGSLSGILAVNLRK